MKTYNIRTELIDAFMAEQKLSKAAFAGLCRVSAQTLRRVLRNQNISLLSIAKIAHAMGLKLRQLII